MYLTFNIQSLQRKGNRTVRENNCSHITKLGFEGHPNSNSAGKSHVTAVRSPGWLHGRDFKIAV